MPDNPISFLLSLAVYLSKAAPKEQSIGTIRFTGYFLVSTLLVQVIFTAGIFALTLIPTVSPLEVADPSRGLWGLVMVEVLIECGEDIEAPVKY